MSTYRIVEHDGYFEPQFRCWFWPFWTNLGTSLFGFSKDVTRFTAFEHARQTIVEHAYPVKPRVTIYPVDPAEDRFKVRGDATAPQSPPPK
jgi:hypothetical protein